MAGLMAGISRLPRGRPGEFAACRASFCNAALIAPCCRAPPNVKSGWPASRNAVVARRACGAVNVKSCRPPFIGPACLATIRRNKLASPFPRRASTLHFVGVAFPRWNDPPSLPSRRAGLFNDITE